MCFYPCSQRGSGYYSSKKKDGYGGQDLYIITFLGAAKPMIIHEDPVQLAYHLSAYAPQPAPKIEQNTVLQGVVLDAESLHPCRQPLK
ncbi:MAG: hypothetical protein R2764_08085 [Bacteroidales bacterium]